MVYTHAMTLRFSKYEGLGNDFVIVDGDAVTEGRKRAVEICDRHLGIGADGVLLVQGGTSPRMDVVNADGSVPEMCGNGLRCVALHLVRTGQVAGPSFEVQTAAGPHACHVFEQGRIQVDMPAASLQPEDLPMAAPGPLVDSAQSFGGQQVRLTGVSMGNPHAVIFDDVGEGRLALAPAIAGSSLFPEGVNVGFASALDTGGFELHVLERGAGWTRACGTGACACAVAAVETGLSARGAPLDIRLPGGVLQIVVGPPTAPVRMTGPARHVFDGVLNA